MRRRAGFALFTLFFVLATAGLVTVAQRAAPPPRMPGLLPGGITQLPNGWRISPVGRHAPIGDLPLNMVWSPDGRYLIITNNGWAKPTLTIFDTENFYIKSTVSVENAWLGLAWDPDGRRLFASGAAENVVNEFAWNGETLKQGAKTVLQEPELHPTFDNLKDSGFIGGISATPDGKRLFAVQVFGTAVSMIDVEQRRVLKTAHLRSEPYSTIVSADGKLAFVSSWGGGRVLAFDTETLEPRGEIAVGEHPNAMIQSKDGSRLFVACANTNAVWVVDIEARKATEQIGVALFPKAPPGTTPNALALSPDGNTLLVANADNNTRGGRRRRGGGREPRPRLHPDRLVSDWVAVDNGGTPHLRRERQGMSPSGESDGARRRASGGRTASTSATLLQGTISRGADARRDPARGVHRARVYELRRTTIARSSRQTTRPPTRPSPARSATRRRSST